MINYFGGTVVGKEVKNCKEKLKNVGQILYGYIFLKGLINFFKVGYLLQKGIMKFYEGSALCGIYMHTIQNRRPLYMSRNLRLKNESVREHQAFMLFLG